MKLRLSDLLDTVSFYDPAGSSGGSTLTRAKARAAVVTIGQDRYTRIFVLDAWAARAHTSEQRRNVLAQNARWRPRIFGCEKNGVGEHAGPTILEEAQRQGVPFPMRLVPQPSGVDKLYRIKSILQPVIADGRLFIPVAFHELRAEVSTFPSCLTFDLIDALASAVALLPRRTAMQTDATQERALIEYLHDIGRTPDEIAGIVGHDLDDLPSPYESMLGSTQHTALS